MRVAARLKGQRVACVAACLAARSLVLSGPTDATRRRVNARCLGRPPQHARQTYASLCNRARVFSLGSYFHTRTGERIRLVDGFASNPKLQRYLQFRYG